MQMLRRLNRDRDRDRDRTFRWMSSFLSCAAVLGGHRHDDAPRERVNRHDPDISQSADLDFSTRKFLVCSSRACNTIVRKSP